jgi:hypothetical protein
MADVKGLADFEHQHPLDAIVINENAGGRDADTKV